MNAGTPRAGPRRGSSSESNCHGAGQLGTSAVSGIVYRRVAKRYVSDSRIQEVLGKRRVLKGLRGRLIRFLQHVFIVDDLHFEIAEQFVGWKLALVACVAFD
jgi:hypothetical protein